MHEHHHKSGMLGRVRATLLPTCREMSRHSSHALDGPLPLLQRFGVGLHLACCSLCRRYRKQLQWLHQAARLEMPTSAVTGRLPEARRERLKQALRKGAAATPTPVPPSADGSTPSPSGPR